MYDMELGYDEFVIPHVVTHFNSCTPWVGEHEMSTVYGGSFMRLDNTHEYCITITIEIPISGFVQFCEGISFLIQIVISQSETILCTQNKCAVIPRPGYKVLWKALTESGSTRTSSPLP